MNKTALVILSIFYFALIPNNLRGKAPDLQPLPTEFDTQLQTIIERAQTEKRNANQAFLTHVLYPRQKEITTLYARAKRFLIDLCPPPFVLRILRFLAPLHAESFKTLVELKLITEPYIQMLELLETSAKTNEDLIKTILESDKKLKPQLSTNIPCDHSQSICDSYHRLCARMLEENIQFYAGRITTLTTYCNNLRDLKTQYGSIPQSVQREIDLTEAEIQSFSERLATLDSPHEAKVTAP